MKYLEKNKGITLIALIVTIVVLLILAGVTINAITGSESAMEKATEAREKDKQGTELEVIKLAVVNSVANGLTGLVDTDSLKSGLVGLIQENPEDVIIGNGPWVVTSPSGQIYEINQNTIVNKLEPLNISSNLTITENKVKSLTVTKYGSAIGKQVSWNKEGNIIFVTDETGKTPVENPTTDTIYIKAGAYDDGKSGKVIISANDEESQECSISVAEREWSKIGESVTYQSKYEKDNNITIGWRLFYRDDYYTYIIADKLSKQYEKEIDSNASDSYTPSSYYSLYTQSSFELETNVAKEINPMLTNNETTLALFSSNTLSTSFKTLALLCDTDYWKDFTKNQTVASVQKNQSYAIACPPIEMFVSSYNTAAEENNLSERLTGLDVNSNGYLIPSGYISKTICNGMYDKAYCYWLSSPYNSTNSLRVMWRERNTTIIDAHRPNVGGMAIRPLVAIPNANFDFATLTVK